MTWKGSKDGARVRERMFLALGFSTIFVSNTHNGNAEQSSNMHRAFRNDSAPKQDRSDLHEQPLYVNLHDLSKR
jgi:hypothetical protein